MNLQLTTLFLFCCTAAAWAQDTSAAIIAEGKRLYRSEMASWYGTDIFLDRFKDKRDLAGGYFSYADGAFTRCIFYSRGDQPKVVATIEFDSSFLISGSRVGSEERDFTSMEKDFYAIRKRAKEAVSRDTLFKEYENTNFNLIPLIEGREKKVYVLTGTTAKGVVLFGNDYLLTFDEENRLTGSRRLHAGIIPVQYGKEGEEVISSMHTHLPQTGEYITPTDICTLMLYGKLTKWKQHIVVSPSHVSIWDGTSNQLAILTKEAWERIYRDQKKRRKKN